MNIDQRLIQCVLAIESRQEPCTHERLVAECFKQFPEHFALRDYPQWPDSARVNKTWLRCRTDRGWLSGNAKRLFLTPLGREVAERLRDGITPPDGMQPHVKKTPDDWLQELKRSNAYEKHVRGEKITRRDALASLGLLEETPRRLIRAQLRKLQGITRKAADKELLLFLLECERTLNLKWNWKGPQAKD